MTVGWCVCTHECKQQHMVCVWLWVWVLWWLYGGQKDNFVELIISFHTYKSSRDWTQVSKWEHLASQEGNFLYYKY